MEVPDTPGDGFRWKRISLRSFSESFMKIEPQETGQDSTCPLNLSKVLEDMEVPDAPGDGLRWK